MSYTHRHPSRRHAELSLEGDGEMRAVLESHFVIHVRGLVLPVAEHLVCLVQPLPDEPLLRRKVAHFGEVTLEGGEAAPGVGGKFLQGHILCVVRLHKGQQVYLPRLVEVEQRGIETHIRIEQAINRFLHLQADDFIVGLDIRVRVGEERKEHVTARADGQRPPLVLHHHLARIDVDKRMYWQAVLRQHLVRDKATIHDVPMVIYLRFLQHNGSYIQSFYGAKIRRMAETAVVFRLKNVLVWRSILDFIVIPQDLPGKYLGLGNSSLLPLSELPTVLAEKF